MFIRKPLGRCGYFRSLDKLALLEKKRLKFLNRHFFMLHDRYKIALAAISTVTEE